MAIITIITKSGMPIVHNVEETVDLIWLHLCWKVDQIHESDPNYTGRCDEQKTHIPLNHDFIRVTCKKTKCPLIIHKRFIIDVVESQDNQ